VIDPFGFANHSFTLKTQARGNRAASRIPGAAANRHTVQKQIVEEVIQKRRTTPRNQPLALTVRVQPVSDAAIPVRPVDGVAADSAAKRLIFPDPRVRSAAVFELPAGSRD